jgi:hypothetical protein
MEDIIMVRKANKENPRFLFVGVYAYSDRKSEVISNFLNEKAEVVLPSVNCLPQVLMDIKEGFM